MVIYVWAHTCDGHHAGDLCEDERWWTCSNQVIKFEGTPRELMDEALHAAGRPLSKLGLKIAGTVYRVALREHDANMTVSPVCPNPSEVGP